MEGVRRLQATMHNLLPGQFFFGQLQCIEWTRQYARGRPIDRSQIKSHLQAALNFLF
jgi:hypothetical protein